MANYKEGNAILFLVLNFFIGFVSDIVLNTLNVVPELTKYFKNRNTLLAANSAGLTILSGVIILIVMSFLLFGYPYPALSLNLEYKNVISYYIPYILLAFVIGWILDIIIYKLKIFSDLDIYYDRFGVGFFGGLSLVFTVSISYFFIKIYYAINKNE